MRYGSIGYITFIIVLSVTILSGLFSLVVFHYVPFNLWLSFAFLILFGLVVGLVIFLLLRRLIFRHLNSLYGIVYGDHYSYKNIPPGTGNLLADLEKGLKIWSKNQATEIDHLKQMEKYRKEFLGNVSHELKTPIFNIQGYILTLLDGGLKDDSINRLYIERSEKSISRMIHIIEDLESIARLESGELQLDMRQFNIVSLVEEVFEMHEMVALERKIELEIIYSRDEKIWVYADKKRVLEVVDNLIVNSIMYGRKNGKTTVSFIDKDNRIWVKIADNGIGIDSLSLKRIFERFYRCDQSRSREQGGTGLGLSIVKHIMEAHGQRIYADSTPGEGSVFTFSLEKAKFDVLD